MNKKLFFFISVFSTCNLAVCQDYLSSQKKYKTIHICDEKIEIVKRYITLIADKSLDYRTRTRKVNSVLNHFEEGALIEVSSVNHNKITSLLADEYFRRLRDLEYTKVEITWENELNSISKVTPINNNTYKVIGRYSQRFVGYDRYGNKSYADVTIKTVTIKVQETIDASGETYTNVLITNIGIESTYEEKEYDGLFLKKQ
ncbi:MAG: hypothetical protein NXI26_26425 [bacterium]|uniref:Uncharacterized protein n=1 Tax=Phaeodactylibacter xiamenensis TaxID=1524460 RepID=A0A098RX64_9BACT|nr:hypothetical protein [Phaeodactylibacter xiamenensis]KGE84794.1 hypothetical protein IX84_31850 [Phaeodactylibacter xiamenensis]MCR9055405.1 hypothetical protein [bacterium]